MKHVDMRSLVPAAQAERRRQVIGLRERGLTYAVIAAQVGLTKNGVFDICQRFRACGMAGLRTGPRGPAPGTGRFLTPAQEAQIRTLIRRATPDAYGLPFALWSRAGVAALIEQRCGVRLAVRTMGTYLARWHFTAQKPLRRAYEQRPAQVRHWLETEYPAIAAKARRQKGVVFWGDETGLRSDDVRGRSYAPRGKTPLVRPCHRRATVGLISAVTNLIRAAGCKVLLILDRLPVHRGHAVQEWLAGRRSQIEVFYLPAYSPELNPDEGLNADVKQAVPRKAPARNREALKRNLIGHMRRLSRLPDRIRTYFQHPSFRYAA
jgi:transposase